MHHQAGAGQHDDRGLRAVAAGQRGEEQVDRRTYVVNGRRGHEPDTGVVDHQVQVRHGDVGRSAGDEVAGLGGPHRERAVAAQEPGQAAGHAGVQVQHH